MSLRYRMALKKYVHPFFLHHSVILWETRILHRFLILRIKYLYLYPFVSFDNLLVFNKHQVDHISPIVTLLSFLQKLHTRRHIGTVIHFLYPCKLTPTDTEPCPVLLLSATVARSTEKRRRMTPSRGMSTTKQPRLPPRRAVCCR